MPSHSTNSLQRKWKWVADIYYVPESQMDQARTKGLLCGVSLGLAFWLDICQQCT
jgi:hypothetical protein